MRNSRFTTMPFARLWPLGLALLVLTILLPLSTFAQTNSTWTGAGDGVSWNDPLNWSAGVPNGAFNAFVDGNNLLFSNVVTGISSSFFIESLTVDAGDTLTIQNNSDFGIVTNANPLSGNINNDGTIFITNAFNSTDLVIDGVVNVNGSGTITLNGSGNASRILDQSGDDGHFINNGNTIDGYGQIGVNSLQLTNQVGGTIDANVTGGTLTIDPNAMGMTNLGVMRATNGGNLALLAGSFDNTGGTIDAGNDSVVTLSNFAVVSGGTLSTSGTGVIEVPTSGTATIADLTNIGTINQLNNTDLFIAGNIDNQGSIFVTNAFNPTDMVVDGATSLSGGGTVTLGGSGTASRILDQSGDDGVLTNVNNTIQGKGQIGVDSLGIVNNGLIVANDPSGTLVVNPSIADLVNQGTMRATGGAELVLTGSGGGQFINTGGLIEAEDNSTVRIADIGAIVGGDLQTSGTGQFLVGPSDNAELHDVTITGTVNVENNSDLELFGTITNNSNTINLINAFNSTDLQIESNVTLTGGGTITLGGVGANVSRILDEVGAADGILTNLNNTIQGHGSIGADRMAMVNQGIVDANSLGNTLTLNPRATDDEFTNTGTLRASNGGELVLSGNGGGRFLNSGGLIEALDGSTVRITDIGAILGGDLQTTGSGQFVVGPGDNAEMHDVTIDGTVNVLNNSDLELVGTITNNSNTINVINAFNSTDLQIESDVTLTGGGTIVLGGSNSTASRILDEVGTADGVLTNVNNTIQGKGSIGVNRMQLINEAAGLIDANDPTGSITLDPSSVAMVNQGTMRASGGGHLVLTSGSFDNSGGLILAADGSQVSITGSVIVSGGDLIGAGAGFFESTGATLADLTIDGTVNQLNSTNLFLNGTINNLGTVNVTNAFNNTNVVVDNATTLTGGGSINLGGSSGSTSRIVDLSGGDGVLTNAGNTIRGYGQVGATTLQVINQSAGTIDADVNGATLTFNSRVSNTNQGTFRASNGGILSVTGGDMANDGVIHADDNSFINFAGMLTSSSTGSLIGNGQIQATSIESNGMIGPGNSVGALTLVGDTMMSSTSLLDIELDSSGADLLSMIGNLNLDGSLQLSLLGGFLPMNNDMFTIINVDAGNALTGTFANVGDGEMLAATGGLGGTFTVNYFSNSVVLSNFVVNAIPEPGSAALLVVFSAGFLARRRRR